MATSTVIPYLRKREMNASTDPILVDRPATTSAEIQRCEFYDSAFLADRGCIISMLSEANAEECNL
jgi:hypothetical protein